MPHEIISEVKVTLKQTENMVRENVRETISHPSTMQGHWGWEKSHMTSGENYAGDTNWLSMFFDAIVNQHVLYK